MSGVAVVLAAGAIAADGPETGDAAWAIAAEGPETGDAAGAVAAEGPETGEAAGATGLPSAAKAAGMASVKRQRQNKEKTARAAFSMYFESALKGGIINILLSINIYRFTE